MCSFYLNNDSNRKAEFTLGGYNIEKYAKDGLFEDDVHWTNLLDNKYYWSVGFPGIEIEGEQFSISATYAILDTGTSLSVIPSADFTLITDFLTDKYGVEFVLHEGSYYADCGW